MKSKQRVIQEQLELYATAQSSVIQRDRVERLVRMRWNERQAVGPQSQRFEELNTLIAGIRSVK